MGKRSRITLLLSPLAGIAAGGAIAFWASQPGTGERFVFDRSIGDLPAVSRALRFRAPVVNTRPELEESGRLGLRPTQASDNPADAGDTASRDERPDQTVRLASAAKSVKTLKRLALDLPSDLLSQGTEDDRFDGTDTDEPENSDLPGSAFDFESQPQIRPEVEANNLFNPAYGLRGFMKQGWVNQRLAIQGGLGLNDDRLIQTDTKFQDNIAVGMGVMLAF